MERQINDDGPMLYRVLDVAIREPQRLYGGYAHSPRWDLIKNYFESHHNQWATSRQITNATKGTIGQISSCLIAAIKTNRIERQLDPAAGGPRLYRLVTKAGGQKQPIRSIYRDIPNGRYQVHPSTTLKYIQDHPGLDWRQISAGIKLGENGVRKQIRKLADQGKITIVPHHGNRPAVYHSP